LAQAVGSTYGLSLLGTIGTPRATKRQAAVARDGLDAKADKQIVIAPKYPSDPATYWFNGVKLLEKSDLTVFRLAPALINLSSFPPQSSLNFDGDWNVPTL